MDSQALLAHILSQTRQNIEFLITQNQIAANDGRDILAKLPPPVQLSPTPAQPSVATLTHQAHNLSISSMPMTRVDSSPAPGGSPYPPYGGPVALFRAKALWSYNEHGQDPNDLSFLAGDVIDITAETNADWWTGSHKGKQGLFPSNYVDRLAPPASAGSLPSPVPTYTSPSSYSSEKPPTNTNVPTSPYPPYQPAGGYQPPPPGGAYNPYGGPAQPQPPAGDPAVNPEQPPKKGKFGGKFGSTLAHSAVGGVGFGAGSAVGSGIINSIF